MRFDPMTGEPVTDLPAENQPEPVNEGPVLGFDPMTGKPLTGLPITNQPEPVNEGPVLGFDPMTGKPLTKQPEPVNEEPVLGFDPMTGKPLTKQPEPVNEEPVLGFDPMTGKPLTGGSQAPKKAINTKLPLVIGAVVLGAALLIGIAAMAMSSGLFLGKPGQVMAAAVNTVKKKPHILEALEPLKMMNGGKYTVSFTGEIEQVKFEGEFRNGKSEKQVRAMVQPGKKGTKLELLAGVDNKAARMYVPALSKYVFTYNYKDKDKNTGYLMEDAPDKYIDILNASLEKISDEPDYKGIYSKVNKAFADEFKRLKFSSAEEEDYTVDEKDVSCKGYRTVITSANVINIVDKLEKIANEELSALTKTDAVDEDDLAEAFDSMRDDIDDMDDIEITFYVYKNQLAAVVLENADTNDKVEICFEGGDYRMQNMTFKAGEERVRLLGEASGSKEEFTLESKRGAGGTWRKLAYLKYDYESGKFSVASYNSSEREEAAVSGRLIGSKSEVSVKISEVKSDYYSASPDLNFTVKKGAKMEKFDGKEFDIGKADEDDVSDVESDIRDNIMDKDLGYLMGGILSYGGASALAPAEEDDGYNW